ncbi:hypothetical protein C8J57DRAFT_1326174 [Mycena rebaudengoi]|nr:hypothetical protein C8J57DRAFT_1326174 [Mycena rebaudengoi]
MLNRHGIDTSHTSRPPTEQFVLHSYFVVHPRLLPLRHLLSHSSLYFRSVLSLRPPPSSIRRPPAPGTRGERSECAREGGDYPEPWKQKLRWYDHRRTRRAVFPAPWSWRSGIAAGVAPPCRVAFPSRVAMSFIIIVFCRVCGHGQYRDAGVSV